MPVKATRRKQKGEEKREGTILAKDSWSWVLWVLTVVVPQCYGKGSVMSPVCLLTLASKQNIRC